jgi:ribosomal protein S18 acetylase RimI-like enzyme
MKEGTCWVSPFVGSNPTPCNMKLKGYQNSKLVIQKGENVIIREAKKSDLNQIKEMNWNFFNFYLDNKFDDLMKRSEKARIWGRRFIDRTFKNKNWKYFVAEDNKKLVGFINGKVDNCYPIYGENKHGVIWLVYVDESYRNKGIGKKLVNKLITWLKKKKIKFVETSVSPLNKISQKMLESLGFKEIEKKYRLKINF